MGEIPPSVAAASARIGRRAAEYAEYVSSVDRRVADQELLEQLARLTDRLLDYLSDHAEDLLDRSWQHGRGLVFDHLYEAVWTPSADEAAGRVPAPVFAALLAAETEFRGPLRLGARQSTRLAEIYEGLGARLVAELPRLAMLAFQRAGALYRTTEDIEGEDRCGLARARARTRAAYGWQRAVGLFADSACGYGYRPFRLLGWVGAQLVLFTVAGLLLGGASTEDTVYLCVTGFLIPIALGDIAPLHRAARPLFSIESWAGTVSLSVFFALLVRKWFRL